MTQDKYAKQEESTSELVATMPLPLKGVQIKGFPSGRLFTRLDPDSYRSFRDITKDQYN